MRRGTIRTMLTMAAAASLLAACGSGSGDDPTADRTDEPTSTADATTDPTDEPTDDATTADATGTPSDDGADGPPFPDGTADQVDEVFDAELVLTEVRVAEHPTFDRLVLEFEGDGVPGWRVGYVDEASTAGKGDPIDLDTDALLRVSATHVMAADMSGYYDGPRQFDPDTEVIDEVFVDGTFEGETVVVLGLDDVEVFRVFTLTEPSRLVVDVQDS